jgi:two-component sensor histidine kinase
MAMAMIASSHEPLLLLDGALNVIAASGSFCRAFQVPPDGVAGRSFFAMGQGEWDVAQLRVLLGAIASGSAEVEAYEFELQSGLAGKRCLVLNAHKLAYGEASEVRLLIGIADVTEARASDRVKEDLARDKAILMQEVQHRIANSLQIIASVLMQSARKVHSNETRDQLTQAHHRIVSVAEVQRHLMSAGGGQVALAPDLTRLCESLGASMIQDPTRLQLMVLVDDSTTEADASVSLGLIVTELVINALKHAFPHHKRGKITVNYQRNGADWTLSVVDNGVGMPPVDSEAAKPGLGTSIVEALAKQLNATVFVADTSPGTAVSIIHKQAADAANANAGPAERAV